MGMQSYFSVILACILLTMHDTVAQAAIAKSHRLGGLNNRKLFLKVLEVESLRPGCQYGQFDESLQIAAFLPHPHTAERKRRTWCIFL